MGAQVQRAWQRLGENVGWAQRPETSESGLVDQLHQYFMASAGHRDNILRPDYTWIGVAVRVTASGKMWTTVNFMNDAGGAAPHAPPHLGPPEFHDVSGGIHAPSIKTIALAGITQGCTAELFCPDRQVTRAQMASFLVRALNLPVVAHDQFSDDRGSSHEGAINSLAAAGISQGCADGFCPNTPVTRAQMASFIQRAWDLPVTSTSDERRLFSDLGHSVHSSAINAIADVGITLGCGDGRYCPGHPVRRAEMASLLARALDLN